MVTIRGNAISLLEKFYLVDPNTGDATLTDPSGVVFIVEQPDGTEVSYVYGVASEVTRESTGVFLCALTPPLPTGTYTYVCVGSGAVEATGRGTFTISESGVLAPDTPTVAEYGPCSPWITGDDVLNACGGQNLTDGDAYRLETAAAIGSQIMWDLSARLFDGICERTVRPCRLRCTCWDAVSIGNGLFASAYGVPWYWGNSYWYGDHGDRCGCGSPLSTVKLAGYPVREILEVKIGGDVVDPDTYRLDSRRDLVRLDDVGPPLTRRLWPNCQNRALPDTEPGTFSVTYSFGQDPPPLGREAAAQVGCEVYKALHGRDCKLPAKATRIVRQGITIERVQSIAAMWKVGATGLPLVDMFLATSNPTGAKSRPAVFNLDGQQFAQKLGQ